MKSVEEQFRTDADFLEAAIAEQKAFLSADEKLILERIHGPLHTDLQPYELNELSPTPLDASNLVASGAPYQSGALDLMVERMDSRLHELGVELPAGHYNGILVGIETEHTARVLQNGINRHQLVHAFLADPSSIGPALADSIYLARLAGASEQDLLDILASHPKTKITAIEQAKATFPLHPAKITEARYTTMARLYKLQRENREFSFRELSQEEQRATRRPVDLGELTSYGNLATKSAIARASFKGVNLTLKHRESFILLPPTLDLGNNPKNIRALKGELLNIQPVGFSNYWAVDGPSGQAS